MRVWWSACEYDASNAGRRRVTFLGICQKMKPLGGGKKISIVWESVCKKCTFETAGNAFDSDVLRRVFVEVPIRRGADQMFSAFRCNPW